MSNIYAEAIDGIERPCQNCDTVSIHATDPRGSDCKQYAPKQFTVQVSAFDAMLVQARHLGLPTSYTSDLFRDYEILSGTSCFTDARIPQEFLWAVYSMGTHMVPLDGPLLGDGPFSASGSFSSILQAFGRDKMHWFHWNGARLRALGSDAEAERIAVNAHGYRLKAAA